MDFDMFDVLKYSPDIELKMKWVCDIIQGIEFLHSMRIAHRDIKPENILLRNGSAKISDFGLSEIMNEQLILPTSTKAGTLQYAAPEVLFTKGKPIRGDLADRWSLAVTIFVLMVGAFPYTIQNLQYYYYHDEKGMKDYLDNMYNIHNRIRNIPTPAWAFITSNMRLTCTERGF